MEERIPRDAGGLRAVQFVDNTARAMCAVDVKHFCSETAAAVSRNRTSAGYRHTGHSLPNVLFNSTRAMLLSKRLEVIPGGGRVAVGHQLCDDNG